MNKSPPIEKWVWKVNELSAPLNFSTPFPITRYQRKADSGEWCCYFCNISSQYESSREIIAIFSVLHKSFTAFAYRIRAPPSEV